MAHGRGKLLTASDLATLCEVDLKTIHNWVDRGRIPHFRTPGRHLRFRPADVAGFLRTWGYTVPRELSRATSRSVLVIGSKETAAHVIRALGDGLPLRSAEHAYDALVFAGADPADVYLIDMVDVASQADPLAVLDALHRASPDATFVALTNDAGPLPSFVKRVGRDDAATLASLLALDAPASPAAPMDEVVLSVAAGGSSR